MKKDVGVEAGKYHIDTSALSMRPLHLRRAGVLCHRDRGMSNTVQEEITFLLVPSAVKTQYTDFGLSNRINAI